MSVSRKAVIAGVFEHPLRNIPHLSAAQIHAEVAAGALADAGLSFDDVDGFFCAGDAPGLGSLSMVEYLGLSGLRYLDSSEMGGASYVSQVGHAASAIAAGKCSVGLITLAGRPRQELPVGSRPRPAPEAEFELPYGTNTVALYALAARRYMHEFGATSEQLAAVRVAASQHAQHNPNAFLQTPVTIADVMESRMVSDPLHLLDCCVVTDGGGAVVVVSPEVARNLDRSGVLVLGHGEATKNTELGRIDLTYTGAVWSGPRAFEEAGVTCADIDYASIYDSFTITVVETIEDLGFCEKGKGAAFAADGALLAPYGRLPWNTDGGGLCNNHPANRGGVTKVIEAVRQLRGEAHPAVQVPDPRIALVHGTGASLATRMGSATLIVGAEDA